jgi:hypothetical protein
MAPARRLTWGSALLVAAVAATVVTGGCTGGTVNGGSPTTTPSGSEPASTASELRWRGDGEFGVRITVPNPGVRYSEGLRLCVSGPAPAEVTSVRFAKGAGVSVHRYAVRLVDPERSDYLGSQQGTLQGLGFVPTPGRAMQVSARCGAEGLHSELGLEVSLAPGNRAGRASDLRVQYQSLTSRGEVKIPFELQMCQPGAPESFCH